MTNNTPAKPPAWRHLTAAILLVAGLGLLAVSFVLPSRATSRANWSPDQARAYQDASVKLHNLSFEAAHAAGTNDEKAVHEKLKQAEAEYGELRTKLDAAIDRPKQITTALRIGGTLLIAIGAVAIFYMRGNSSD